MPQDIDSLLREQSASKAYYDRVAKEYSTSSFGDYVTRGTEQLRTITKDHAGQTMLCALAAGLGVGILIGKSMGSSTSGKSWLDRRTAENVGHRFLDHLRSVSPEAIKKHLGS